MNALEFDQLQRRLPHWYFEDYGSCGAVACFPPKMGSDAFNELNSIAVISSVCGPFYTVNDLRAGQAPSDS